MSDTTLYLGRALDDAGRVTTDEVRLDPADLTTHGVIVGMTGSGKTGLAISLIEEALLAGVPVLAIDPKGDLADLLLTFPALAPADFAPWVPEGQDPAEVAAGWAQGLADWGITAERIAELRRTARMGVYTPGSTAATPINIIGNLSAPVRAFTAGSAGGAALSEEDLADEIGTVTAGLLGLVGIQGDPLASPPHLLVSNLLRDAWAKAEPLDLASLIGRVQTPPMRALGVMEIDQVIPPKDRSALAVRLNGVLATPGFAAWVSSAPLDMQRLLFAQDGRPSLACVSIGHLSDDQRQMAVSRILTAVIRWYRSQPGTDRLRALVYIDEVMGFVPPTAMPPTKAPILTIMKQARAFGVGMVLATQNPVDLAYKTMSNAGTWMVGRLQTDRDKARLLEGMNTVAGGVDLAALDATITGLGKRQFLLHQTKGNPPVRFGTRWAMSYLRGPVTGAQLAQLPGREEVGAEAAPTGPTAAPAPAEAAPAATAAGGPGVDAAPERGPGVDGAPEPPPGVDAAPQPPPGVDAAPEPPPGVDAPAGPAGGEVLAVMPKVADGVPVRHLDPAAPWGALVGVVPDSTTLTPMIALRVNLTYDDKAAGVHEVHEWEAIVPHLGDITEAATAIAVDHDERDLRTEAPAGARYVSTGAGIDTLGFYTELSKGVKEHLTAQMAMTVMKNRKLKLWSRPGENSEEFAVRCDEAAQGAADAETEKIRQTLAARIDRVRQAMATAEQKADSARANADNVSQSSTVSTVGSLLGGLLGGGSRTRGMATAARRAMTERDRRDRAQARADEAAARVADKADDLQALSAELQAAVVAIDDKWRAVSDEVEEVRVGLARTDVAITMMALVWVPT